MYPVQKITPPSQNLAHKFRLRWQFLASFFIYTAKYLTIFGNLTQTHTFTASQQASQSVEFYRYYDLIFWVFWSGQRTFVYSINIMALPEWFKHLVYLMWRVSILEQQNCSASFFTSKRISVLLLSARVFLSFWVSQNSNSCSIRTKTFSEWYKNILYTQWNVFKHLKNKIEVVLIPFTSKFNSVDQFCN